MKQALAYLRVSTASQTDGDGFPRQKDACRRFAESKGWSVARFFEEQQSGSDQLFDRPLMQELLALCGGGMFDTIIVERVDRVARDVVIAELFFRECKKRGVSVYAADSGEELVNAEGDPTRTLIRQILGALAEWDKAQICRKLQAGRRRKKMATGKPCGGPIPYGHNVSSERRDVEAWALDLIVWKVREELQSHAKVAKLLQAWEIPTPGNAKKWTRGIVHHLYHQNSQRKLPPKHALYPPSFARPLEQKARRIERNSQRRRESSLVQSEPASGVRAESIQEGGSADSD